MGKKSKKDALAAFESQFAEEDEGGDADANGAAAEDAPAAAAAPKARKDKKKDKKGKKGEPPEPRRSDAALPCANPWLSML